MRFLIIIIWLILGVFYWKCHMVCCHEGKASPTTITPVEKIQSSVKKLTPLRFDCSGAIPNTEPEWVSYRDSLLNNLSDNELLVINGQYYEDETTDAIDNLGLERARNVLKLLDNVGEDRVRLRGTIRGDSCLHSELNNLIIFRYARNSAKIKEVDDKTMIYFPYGSTQKLDDAEVEAYLDEVITKIKKSGESVKLTGHTDNDGSASFNMKLGEKRAIAIQDYFIKNGLTPQRVIVTSRGEKDPIASNDTEEGRAKNRRTELEILK
jgi:OOP family OmpA-OmpF porin